MKLGKRFLTLAFAVGIGLCAYPYANASESGHAHWGYEGEHEMPPNWQVHAWKAARGYAGEDNENRRLERIWFSPHCLPLEAAQGSLFSGGAP